MEGLVSKASDDVAVLMAQYGLQVIGAIAILILGRIAAGIVKNFAGYDTRCVDLVIGVGYGSSIEKAVEFLEGLIAADARVLEDPPPQIAVSELADSSVNLVVRPWVNGPDYWAFRFEMTRKIKESFDANGIEIPFPQRVVHMQQDG